MPTAYVTAPREVADDIAARLVHDGVAACVNRLDCRSTYRWEGEVIEDEEVVLLAKTTDDAYGDLAALVAEIHPHDVPCIERFDEADVHPPFRQWVRESVDRG